MPRVLAANLAQDLAQGYAEAAYLIELQFSGGTVRVTTASRDLTYQGNTYQALGGHLALEGIGDTPDQRAQGHRLTLSGVDQTIMALILAQQMKGRLAVITYVRINRGTNLLLRAEELDHTGAWSRNNLNGVTPNTRTDHLGRLVLDTVMEDGTNNAHWLRQLLTASAGNKYHYLRGLFRPSGRDKGMLYIQNGADRTGVNFDLAVPSVATAVQGAGTLLQSGIEVLTRDVFEVWFIGKVNATATALQLDVRLRDAAGAATYLGTAGLGWFAGGIQWAESEVRLPYIPTVDAGRVDGQVTLGVEMFRGYMNEAWEVTEERPARPEEDGPATCIISTRLTSRLAALKKVRGIRTNVDSHQAYSFASTDTFFQHVPQIAGRQVYWGRPNPAHGTFGAFIRSQSQGR